MAFKTPFKPYNPYEALQEQRKTPVYSSPMDAMIASLKMSGDPSVNSTFAVKELYDRFQMEYFPEGGNYKYIPPEEANERFQPREAYTEPVREDLAMFDYKARKANEDLEMIMGSVNPKALGGTTLPMIGMIGASLGDPLAIGMDLVATKGLGTLAKMTMGAVKAQRVAKMAQLVAKFSQYKAANVGGMVAKSLLDNTIGNIAPELIVSLRNKQVQKDPTVNEFIENIAVGAIAGSIIELGIMNPLTGKYKKPPPTPEPEPQFKEHTPAYPMSEPFVYGSIEEGIAHAIPTMEAMSHAGVTPYLENLDYSPENLNKVKEYATNPANRYFRDVDIESDLGKTISDKVGQIKEFTSNADYQNNLFDVFLTKAEKNLEWVKKTTQRLADAEAKEKARVEQATADAQAKSIDANYELRVKQTKYRQKLKNIYDSMGGDFSSLHGIGDDLMEMGIEPTPELMRYLTELDDAVRYFGDKSKVDPVVRKTVDVASIYRENYDHAANEILREWGFDSEYKPIAVEAREQGAIYKQVDDLDNIAILERELSPMEAIEALKERAQLEPTFRKRDNKMKVVKDIEAKQKRLKEQKNNYEEMHSALIDELKKDKHIDHLLDIMEEAEMATDPATKMELMETLEEATQAMEDALGPEKFRNMMDELTLCIRG